MEHNIHSFQRLGHRHIGVSITLPTTIIACLLAKPLQSCPTLCDPIDGSPPGSPVPGILQARTLEWVAISQSLGRIKNDLIK